MRTLVLGGIRSGKSSWAETAIAGCTNGAVRYIATGSTDSSDMSWTNRIALHRDRRPASWQTVESIDIAGELRSNPQIPTLVDDLGGWLTAVLDKRAWAPKSITPDIDHLVAAVEAFAAPLVMVSPEVGLAVVPATAAGRRFADEIGILNQRLAQSCDQVVLVVAGLPMWVKPARTKEG